jgi:hypothetical protein
LHFLTKIIPNGCKKVRIFATVFKETAISIMDKVFMVLIASWGVPV